MVYRTLEEGRIVPSEAVVVHKGVFCDACHQAIVGQTRFKCGHCSNYDLCPVCEKNSLSLHNPDHVFLKLRRPLDTFYTYVAFLRPEDMYAPSNDEEHSSISEPSSEDEDVYHDSCEDEDDSEDGEYGSEDSGSGSEDSNSEYERQGYVLLKAGSDCNGGDISSSEKFFYDSKFFTPYQLISPEQSDTEDEFIVVPPVPKCFDLSTPLDSYSYAGKDVHTQTDLSLITKSDLEVRNPLEVQEFLPQFKESVSKLKSESVFSQAGAPDGPSSSTPRGGVDTLDRQVNTIPESGLVVAREKDRDSLKKPALIVRGTESENDAVSGDERKVEYLDDSSDEEEDRSEAELGPIEAAMETSQKPNQRELRRREFERELLRCEEEKKKATNESDQQSTGRVSVLPLPGSIEGMAEYAIDKVMKAGAGVAKNFMDYMRNMDEYVPQQSTWVPNEDSWVPKEDDWAPTENDWVPREENWVPHCANWTPQITEWTPGSYDYNSAVHLRTNDYVPQPNTWYPSPSNYVPPVSGWAAAHASQYSSPVLNQTGALALTTSQQQPSTVPSGTVYYGTASPASTQIRSENTRGRNCAPTIQPNTKLATDTKLASDFEDIMFKLINLKFNITPEVEDMVVMKLKSGLSVYDTSHEVITMLLNNQSCQRF